MASVVIGIEPKSAPIGGYRVPRDRRAVTICSEPPVPMVAK
jgi:hypothetical protein